MEQAHINENPQRFAQAFDTPSITNTFTCDFGLTAEGSMTKEYYL